MTQYGYGMKLEEIIRLHVIAVKNIQILEWAAKLLKIDITFLAVPILRNNIFWFGRGSRFAAPPIKYDF
jgi:hypothetical protein